MTTYQDQKEFITDILKQNSKKFYGCPNDSEMNMIYNMFKHNDVKEHTTQLEKLYKAAYFHINKKFDGAIELYSSLFVEGLHTEASIAAVYIDLKLYGSAIKWFKKGIRAGKTTSMNNLGCLYDHLDNNKKAIKYYKMAIKNGCKNAPNNLIRLYRGNNMWVDLLLLQFQACAVDLDVIVNVFDGISPLNMELINILRSISVESLPEEIKLFKQYL